MSSPSGIATSSIDSSAVLTRFAQFGLPGVLLLIPGLYFLTRVRFRFSRLENWVALREGVVWVHDDVKLSRYAPVLKWIAISLFLILPLTLLLTWGIVVAATLAPALVGITIALLVPAALFSLYAVLYFRAQGFRLSRTPRFYLVLTGLLFFAFAMCAMFLTSPYSFLGIASIFMACNTIPLIEIVYINLKGRSISFQDVVDSSLGTASKESGYKVSREPANALQPPGPEHEEAEQCVIDEDLAAREIERKRKILTIILYVISLLPLLAFAIVQQLVPSENNEIGWILFSSIFVIDFLVLFMYLGDVMTRPSSILFSTLLVRVAMIGLSDRYFFLGQCLVYLVFGITLCYETVSRIYPSLSQQAKNRAGRHLAENVLQASAEESHNQCLKVMEHPVFLLVIFTLVFALMIILFGVRVISNQPVVVYGTEQAQYIFGIASLFVVIVVGCLVATYRIYQYDEKSMALSKETEGKKRFPLRSVVYSIVLYVIWLGLGLALYFLTRSGIILSVAIFALPILLGLFFTIRQWIRNDYEFFEPSILRPPLWRCCAIASDENDLGRVAPELSTEISTTQGESVMVDGGGNAGSSGESSLSSASHKQIRKMGTGRELQEQRIRLNRSDGNINWQAREDRKPLPGSPQEASFCAAFWCCSLSSGDILMFSSICIQVACVSGMMGLLIGMYRDVWTLGFSIFFVYFILTMTVPPVYEWYFTLQYSWESILMTSFGSLMWLIYGIVMLTSGRDQFSSTLFRIFVFLWASYPLIVVSLMLYSIWRSVQWELNRAVVVLLIVSFSLFVALIVTLSVFISLGAGMGLLGVLVLVSFAIIFVSYFEYIAPFLPQDVASAGSLAISAILLVAGAIIGYSLGAAFIGFSISASALFLFYLSTGFYGVVKNKSAATINLATTPGGLSVKPSELLYSQYIIPAYRYDARRDVLFEDSSPVIAIFLALFILLLWSILATIFLSPPGIGLSCLSASVVLIYLFVTDRLRLPHFKFGRVAGVVSRRILFEAREHAARSELARDEDISDDELDEDNEVHEAVANDVEASANTLNSSGTLEPRNDQGQSASSSYAKKKRKRMNLEQVRKTIWDLENRIASKDLGKKTLQQAYFEQIQLDLSLSCAYADHNRFTVLFEYLTIRAAEFLQKQQELELLVFLKTRARDLFDGVNEQDLEVITIDDIQALPPHKREYLLDEWRKFMRRTDVNREDRERRRREEEEAVRKRLEEEMRRRAEGIMRLNPGPPDSEAESVKNRAMEILSSHASALEEQVHNRNHELLTEAQRAGRGIDEESLQLQLDLIHFQAELDTYLDACREFKERDSTFHFKDPDFLPNEYALFQDPEPNSHRALAWKRWKEFAEMERTPIPPELATEAVDGCVLFDITISPDDVLQGALGDCWLLSAMSVIAKDPQRVRELFTNKNANEFGVYGVRLYRDGRWYHVIIDDFVPSSNLGPAYATAPSLREMWPALLEKAYAKFNSTYDSIVGGMIHLALVDLTGGSGEQYLESEPTVREAIMVGTLWEKLLSYNAKGYLMGATSPMGSDTNVSEHGIVEGHVYSILDVVSADGHRLLQLRNPHGETEWTGDWSDSCPLWTKKMRTLVPSFKQEEDGTFFMAFEDFWLNFSSLCVCRIFDDSWHRMTLKSEWNGPTAGGYKDKNLRAKNPQWSLLVKKPTTVFIALKQEEARRLHRDYHPISVFVMKVDGKRASTKMTKSMLVEKSGLFLRQREVSLEVELEPLPNGRPYTIYPSTYEPGMDSRFSIDIFSHDSIECELIPEDHV